MKKLILVALMSAVSLPGLSARLEGKVIVVKCGRLIDGKIYKNEMK